MATAALLASCSGALTKTQSCTEAQRSLLYDGIFDSERYWCTGYSEQFAASELDLSRLRQLRNSFANGVSFYIVGDSIAHQHFRALACTVGIDANASSAALSHWSCYGLDGGRARACYTGGGYLSTPTITHSPGLAELSRSNLLRSGDVIVLSEGTHFRSHVNAPKELSQKVEIERLQADRLASLHVTTALRAGVRVVWRETLAQHWNTSDGLYDQNKKMGMKSTRGCVPLKPATARLIEGYNARISGLVRAAIPEIRIIGAFGMTSTDFTHFMDCRAQQTEQQALQGTGPVERKPACSATTPMDCTHYCERVEEGPRSALDCPCSP